MPDLVLYGSRHSGHSYKVRLALRLLDLPHAYRSIDLAVARSDRPADFQAVSRYGEVPVLVTDGEPLVQSNAILMHLARTTGRLRGQGDPDRAVEWLFWEANRIGFSVPNLRYARMFQTDTPADVVAWLEARAVSDLARLDEELARRSYLLDTLSIVDVACCGYLYWADQAGLDLTRWPHVAAWLDRLSREPGWAHPDVLMGA
ncbi:MAG TPA: glutathione S-transferase family protein [Microvirga sp.]|jgi:glutathione S-transferase